MSGSPEIIHHYSVDTAPRGFLRHAFPMFSYPLRAWESREVVWNFFRRELLGRFKGTAGGVLWVMVQPLIQFAVYFLVFGILFGTGSADPAGRGGMYFAVYLFAGIVLFNSITEGSNRALTSVVDNGNLVKKVAFPCELLPLTNVLVSTTIYAFACGVLLVIGLFLGEVHIGWPILCWPLLVVCNVFFVTGLGLLLAGTNVFARDVQHLYGVFSMAWFFLSPVFWPMSMVAAKAAEFDVPGIMDYIVLNPAYGFLMAQRQIFGIGVDLPAAEYAINYPMSLGTHLVVCAAWGLIMFFVGYGFFMSRKHKFADLV